MTEKLLQYLWNFKVFKNFDFKDIEGNPVDIINFGQWNTNAGPDFLHATIKVNSITLNGHIELHTRASDWIFHHHSHDPNYQNIILHVVYENDMEIEEFYSRNIPTLELKNFIDEKVLWKYEKLVDESQFIPCESIFTKDNIPINFHEENVLKKLDAKSMELEQSLEQSKNNFEAVLFHSLAYSFGLKVNAFLFKQIAESIDFTIINKLRQNRTQLESLLFGICDWLEDPQDEQMVLWKREFDFVRRKYNIPDLKFHPKFSRLRPPNFPTIRISQLAGLYHEHQNLFSKIILSKKIEEIFDLFREIKASDYWNDHFNFGKISAVSQPKMFSKEFIELLILNTVLPFKYTYYKYHNEEIADEILEFYRGLAPEKNSIISSWKKLGVEIADSLTTQSLIYHFKNCCEEKNCLNCGIGFKLLKDSSNA